MKLNPIIPQRKKLHDELWGIMQPNNSYHIEWELKDSEFTYYNECCYNLPIEAYTTPALHLLCQLVKERLHVTDNVIFQVDNREFITGSSYVSGNDKYPSIVSLSTRAVNTLNENELSFLIGHELGHVISRDGLVRFFYKKFFPQDEISQELRHNLHVLDLLSELEADRYGYLACGSIDDMISFMYQLSGGVDIHKFGVSTTTFLNANMRHVQEFMNGGWLGKRHPANALRIEALNIFATAKNENALCVRMEPIIDSIFNCHD